MVNQNPSTQRLGWLRECWIFQAAPVEQLSVLADTATTQRYPRGCEIQRRGDPPSQLLVLARGRAKVCLPSPDHGSEFLVSVASNGSVYGGAPAIQGLPKAAGLIALEDSEFVTVPNPAFREFLEANPPVATRLLAVTTERLGLLMELLHTTRFLDLPSRLYRRLQHFALLQSRRVEDGLYIDHGLHQYDLANSVGASREALNKLLSKWKARGLLDHGRGYITVRDPERLILQVPHLQRVESVFGSKLGPSDPSSPSLLPYC
jgi:CRP-like cAMP-binding protein